MQFWIERPKRRRVWRTQTAAIQAIEAAFTREGITTPFTQRTHRPRENSGFRVETGVDPTESTADYGIEADAEAEDD